MPLQPLTLLVGANGSGKSTVLEALQYVAEGRVDRFVQARTLGVRWSPEAPVALEAIARGRYGAASLRWAVSRPEGVDSGTHFDLTFQTAEEIDLAEKVCSFRMYDLTARHIAAASTLEPGAHLQPEFDQVLFDTPEQGKRVVVLRTRRGRDQVPAQSLSSGTRLVLGLLAIAYGETQTTFLGLEEPETGIHPRLLRNVYDALVRMAYPDPNAGSSEPR